MIRHTIALMVLLSALGCSRQDSAPQSRSSAQQTSGPSLALLGDVTRATFRDGLVQTGCKAKSSASPEIGDRVAVIAQADACVVVVDSTWGPKPIHREDILLARQFSRGPVFIAFSKTSLVDDAELLELEELEMRELMNAYDLPGDTAGVFFDSTSAKTTLPRGYSAAADVLRNIPKQTAQRPLTQVSASATMYSLTEQEIFAPDLATTLQSGDVTLVFSSGPVSVSLQLSSPLSPGMNGEGNVTFESESDTGPAGRFVIAKKNHVIAAGTLMKDTR